MSFSMSNPIVQQLNDATAMDPELKGKIYSDILTKYTMGFNCMKKFTSATAGSGMDGGISSIFGEKQDLKAGGTDTVNFSEVGPPAGPGVMGSDELTGHTSSSLMSTNEVMVGFVRDAVEHDLEMQEFLTVGKKIVGVTLRMLGQKGGLLEQNHMFMRLIRGANGINTYRPNNRTSTDALLSTDVLGLSLANEGRARLITAGANSINYRLSGTGSPIMGYLTFATNTAFLNLRNDDSYTLAVSRASEKGGDNPAISGELVNWGGNPYFELPVKDEKWDDYIGNPMQPKAKLAAPFGANGLATAASADHYSSDNPTTSAAGNYTEMVGSVTNKQNRYFQFFDGAQFLFTNRDVLLTDVSTPLYDNTTGWGLTKGTLATRYAWIINPDGSRGFVSYTQDGVYDKGNRISIISILNGILSADAAAGTSGRGALTVGNLSVGTTAALNGTTGVITPGGNNVTLPNAGWTYTSRFVKGAIVLQANASGVVYGRGFIFGAESAYFAYGRIRNQVIKQNRDYDFAKGAGFMSIFGTGLAKDVFKQPSNYLMLEFAIEHPGYACPSKIDSYNI